MSKEEVDRFVADLATNPEMLAAVTDRAAGLDSIVALAKEHGYEVTLDEAKAHIQGQAERELTDADLEHVAGGKGSTAQSTNVVVAAEGVTSVAGVAEVAAAAVVVIVAT